MTPNKIMHIDLETNNKKHFGAVASPRHPDNYVVAVGWAIDEQPYSGAVQHTYYENAEQAKNWLVIPDDVWLLVAHNAPYELDWMLHQRRPVIEAFLKRGGRVFCTAYGHYLLSNQQDTYPSLDEIAPKYGGSHKIDGIKILWQQGVLTKDIDRDLLIEYLAGPSGDIENTRKCFYGQYQQLVKRGMWKGAITRMEGMLFCAAAVDSGLYVYRDLAFAQMHLQEQRLGLLKASFLEHRSQFPADAEFKETSRFHMSAWIYGGPLKYRTRVSYSSLGEPEQYVKADFYQTAAGGFILKEEADEWLTEEHAYLTYKSGKNKGQIKVFREDTAEVKLKWTEKLYQCPGIASLDGLPNDIRKEFVKDYSGKQTLADGTPVYSTAAEAVKIMSLRNEFTEEVRAVLASLLDFAKLDKDLGTYYLREETDDDGNVIKQAGMLQYLDDLNYVHHNLNCTSTVTGRLSSNKPNFQNLPRGGTSDVKKMFTSRFGNDGFIIEADYSALEVVTLAAFSKDKALTKALVEGIDMHCMRLAQQLDESYESVLEKCKNQQHPDFARYDRMRTDIKPKAFSYQYGATAHGIAFSTGCSVEEAQRFIDAEKALFPEVEAWFDENVFPTVENSTTRHREEVDGVWRLFGTGTWIAPGGTTYEFRQWPKADWTDGQRTVTMQYKPTQMRNYPIQGESGFFVQGCCGLVFRWLLKNDFFRDENGMQRVYIINTVHDAIYLDCHKDVLDIVCENVQRLMESLPTYFNETHGYDLQVPFPAAVEFGHSMFQKLHWHPGVLNDPAYMKGDKLIPSIQDQLKAHRLELEQVIQSSKELHNV